MAEVRAFASFDADALTDADPFGQLGAGVFGVTIDQGPQMTPYQGVTPLSGGSLSACAETYFAQSEQLATRFVIEAAESAAPGEATNWRGGGIMVQQLPLEGGRAPDAPSGADGLMNSDDVAEMGDRSEDWGRVAALLATVETTELIGPHLAPDALLYRLFHEETPRVYDPRKVAFGCTCSAERVQAALEQYSSEDISHMITDDGEVTADCQFCGALYVFDPEEVGSGQ
jgi:molecular chaperone Hsp33